VFLFTTSNHPPYPPPAGYVPRKFQLSAFGDHLEPPPELAERILTTYQYAADALGGFLDALKSSELAQRTVVAAAGDHNTRQFFRYTGYEELPLIYGVPLYFYLPPSQRSQAQFDPRRFASLRDVFPTLYRHSLAGACYLVSGDDLFAPQPAGGSAGLALFDYVLAPEGAIANLTRPQFLRWRDDTYLRLDAFPGEVPEVLRQRALRERARVALLDWEIRMQALHEQPSSPPCR